MSAWPCRYCDAPGAKNLCGHGYLELGAYQQYLNGELVDFDLPQADIDAAAEVLVGMPSAG